MSRVRGVLSLVVLSLPFVAVPSAVAEPVPARPAIFRDNIWHLRDTLTSGFADTSFRYGSSSDDFAFLGDWNDDAIKTPGVRRGNVWHLRNSNSTGFADVTFGYGSSSDFPIIGDWDGDGSDTIGIVRIKFGFIIEECNGAQLEWHLRNANSTGPADEVFVFGCLGLPLSGDWDGSGSDTPAVRPVGGVEWTLNNGFDDTPELVFSFGSLADFPIVGDWDGDQHESVGVVRGNRWFLKNENADGVADSSFLYGGADDLPLIWGDASV